MHKVAESSVYLAQDQFRCLFCQDLLKDPVAIPCGHSYCMSCISGCWDQDDQKGVYSCPQCRQTFTPRPALQKNTILTEVVENIRKRKLQAARPAQCYAESGDVQCDVCTGRKYKAVKSCLLCLESYCQTHFDQHEEIHSRKRHKVTDATGRLQEMICPQHDRLLEMYCRTHQCCICMLCLMNEHKTHETVLPAEERAEKQKHLKESQKRLQQRIQERQKECEELRAAVESHKRSAQTAVEDTERMFNELIRSIERSRSEVTQLIRDQEKAAVSGAEGRLDRLEQEIDDLRRRDAALEQLSHTDHHIHFLQSFQSLSVPPGSTDSSSISSHLSFGDFRRIVSQVKETLQQAFKEGPENMFGIERLEGSNEPEQQFVDEPTIQQTSVGRSERQRYTQGQPRSIVANGTPHPHGSLVMLVQESPLELITEPVDDDEHVMEDAIAPSLQRIPPVRQLKLPARDNNYHFYSNMSPPELEAEC